MQENISKQNSESTKSQSQSDQSKVSIINPFTEKVVREFDYESQSQVKDKLNEAQNAFKSWSQQPLEDRIKIIKKFGKLMSDNKSDLAKLMTEEMGKTHRTGLAEIDKCVEIVNWCCENVEDALGSETIEMDEGVAYNVFSPQGVIFSIQPWNFPFYQVIRYSVPAILAGNATLLRHASNVWGSAQRIEELYSEAGLPDGVFAHLYAKHEDIEFLYEAREVRVVTFTGSPETGKVVAEKAAKNLKKSVLELGGNDAYLVLEDADIDQAVEACVMGRMINNGETCTAAKRFLVVDSVYDEFKEKFVAAVKEVQIGDPNDKATKVGPMARKDLLKKLDDQVQESLDKGASCLVGGNIDKREGYFFQPTILENLKPGMPAYDDELFGPVASLIKVKDLDEAIEVSNSSKFGLGGGIFSKDVDKAIETASRRLDTGMVNVNGYSNSKAQLPFGGVKESGYGREHGRFGFHEYVNVKSVRVLKQDK